MRDNGNTHAGKWIMVSFRWPGLGVGRVFVGNIGDSAMMTVQCSSRLNLSECRLQCAASEHVFVSEARPRPVEEGTAKLAVCNMLARPMCSAAVVMSSTPMFANLHI
jgi:hypothetical protein